MLQFLTFLFHRFWYGTSFYTQTPRLLLFSQWRSRKVQRFTQAHSPRQGNDFIYEVGSWTYTGVVLDGMVVWCCIDE